MKTPDMMYKMKSPRTWVPMLRPIRLNISTITPMPTRLRDDTKPEHRVAIGPCGHGARWRER
jgi:uncharacterized protein (DUF736 family)